MATVNKDFKIKSGLIVEGSTATVGGYDVLTKKPADDQYIIDLIGGETLVKSVSAEFDVSAGGELSLDRATVDAYYDAAGDAAAAEAAAIAHTDARETAITTAYQSYADTAEADAISTAAADATSKANAAQAAAEATASADATSKANAAQAAAEATAAADATSKANAAQAAAEATAAADATSKANAAQAAAELHADEAIAALVGSAPALLDTLQELAAALDNDPDTINSLQDIAAGKQDTLTAGSNIDITDSTISVTGLVAADISDFDSQAVTANTGLWDTIGAAAAAQTAAEGYADGLAVNYDAAGSAATAEANAIAHADALDTDDVEEGVNNLYFSDVRAKTSAAALLTGATLDNITITGDENGLTITAENGVAGSDTDDLAEGTTNLYFTDQRAVDALEAVVPNFTAIELDSVAKQVATEASIVTASTNNAVVWAQADYRSAEFLVNINDGSHTQVSKIVLTLDASDNVAMTEYAIVNSGSTSIGSVSALVVGSTVALTVTTVNNNSDVRVVGTLLK